MERTMSKFVFNATKILNESEDRFIYDDREVEGIVEWQNTKYIRLTIEDNIYLIEWKDLQYMIHLNPNNE